MQFIILFVTQQCWIINFTALECLLSHRSRINTDWFSKRVSKKQASRGIWGILPQKFQLPKVFWVIQTGCLLSAPFDRFQFGKFFGWIILLKLYNFIIIERSDQFLRLQLLSIIIIMLLLRIFLCRDGQLYVVILKNQQRSASPGPVGAEIVLYQLQRFVDLYLNALIDFDLPITIGSLH